MWVLWIMWVKFQIFFQTSSLKNPILYPKCEISKFWKNSKLIFFKTCNHSNFPFCMMVHPRPKIIHAKNCDAHTTHIAEMAKKTSFFHFLAHYFHFLAKKHTKIHPRWLKFGMELRMDVENLHAKFGVSSLNRLGTAVPKSHRYPRFQKNCAIF